MSEIRAWKSECFLREEDEISGVIRFASWRVLKGLVLRGRFGLPSSIKYRNSNFLVTASRFREAHLIFPHDLQFAGEIVAPPFFRLSLGVLIWSCYW